MVKLNHQNLEEYTAHILECLKTESKDSFRNYFLELHPTDQVEIFITLEVEHRRLVYAYLQPAEYAELFQRLDLKAQTLSFYELESSYAVEMFNNMYADDAAAFLGEMPEETAAYYLSRMNRTDAQHVRNLLSYPDETAGAMMTTEFISIMSSTTVSDVLAHLRKVGPDAETIYYLFVVDHFQKLVGVISLRDLLISPLDKKVEDVMSNQVVSVTVHTDQEEVAAVMKKYGFLALPVVDSKGVLSGIVTVDDIMDILEEETTKDFEEISAAKGTVDLDVSSLQAAKMRLPWLILLLFIGMITAGIVGSFEKTLNEVTILAVFIPVIAGMAGNTGTQSLAVVVRGLALGKLDKEKVVHLLKRELAAGIIMGTVCGIIVSVISQFVTHGNLILGFVIGFSLFCTLTVATLAGSIVPLIIHWLKIDPAVASGPFITTINDILGLLIYFSIATAFLSYL